MKRLLYLSALPIFLWFVLCANPVSVFSNSDDSTYTGYTVFTTGKEILDPAWSPDGSRIAFVEKVPALDIYKISINGDTLGLVKRFYKEINENSISVSPDGRYIIFTDNIKKAYFHNTYLYSVAGDTSFLLNNYLPDDFSDMQWSHDSQLIYYKTYKSNFFSINAITPEGKPVFTVDIERDYEFYDYTVAPDKQRIILTGSGDSANFNQLWLYTPAQGLQKLLAADSIHYSTPAWSPDGNSIACLSRNLLNNISSLHIYSLLDTTRKTLIDSINSIDQIKWSADGKEIFFKGNFIHDMRLGIWAFSIANHCATFKCKNNSYYQQINTDGTFYTNSYPDNFLSSLYTFSVTDKKITCLIAETFNSLSHPNWAPDGSNLVFSKRGQLCKIAANGGSSAALNINSPSWSSNTPLLPPDEDIHFCQYCPEYSPDGTMIAFNDGIKGDTRMYVVSVNGGKSTPLWFHFFDCTNQSWSPTGKEIAFVSHEYPDNNDSLIICNYNKKHLKQIKSWAVDNCSICSWSNLNLKLDSFILFDETSNNNNKCGWELKALNTKSGQIVNLVGAEGPIVIKKGILVGACWSPDVESIAWIQNNQDHYSLNIARVFTDIK